MSGAGDIISSAVPSVLGAAGVFALTGNPFLAAAAFAVTFGSSILLAPKEPKYDLSNERKLTIRQPTASRRMVYGEARVSGVMCLVETTRNGKDLHLVIATASHEIDGFGDIFFNEDLIPQDDLDANGVVSSGTFANVARLKFHTGRDAQTADTTLVSEVTNWTSAHRLRGIAYIYAKLTFQTSPLTYPNGIPNISIVIRGKKLYDPRDGQTRWSNNPALVLRDLLTDQKFGLGFSAAAINDTNFAAQANICDEMVDVVENTEDVTVDDSADLITVDTDDEVLRWFLGDRVQVAATGLPGGLSALTDYYVIPVGVHSDDKTIKLASSYANALAGTAIDITSAGSDVTITRTGMPRFTCDGIVDADEKHNEVIGKILSSCAGRLLYNGETWRLLVGAYVAPTVTLDESDLRGPIEVTTQFSRRERFNAIKGIYISPINNWEPSDYPTVESSTFIAEDGETIYRDLELPFTLRPQTAQHIAKIELLRNRQPITVVYPAKLTALRLQAGDTAMVTNDRLGWSSKIFTISDFRLMSVEGDAPYIGVDLVLREIASTDYDFDTSEEQTVDPAPNTNLPSAFAVAVPGGLTITSGNDELAIGADGTVFAQMRIAWTESEAAFVDRYEVQWKLEEESDYHGAMVDGDTLQYVVPGVVAGQVFDVRVRMRNRLGVMSDYTSDQHEVVGKTEAPPVPTAFSVAVAGDGTRRFAWTLTDPPADVTVGGGVKIRWATGVTSDWDSMTDLHDGLLSVSPYETSAPPAGTFTFAIKTFDSSGNESETALFSDLTTLGNPPIGSLLIDQNEADEGWPGTLTDCFISPENYLEADSGTGGTWTDFVGVSWDSLLGASWLDAIPRTTPIIYETEVFDLLSNVSGSPVLTADPVGTATLEMRTHTETEGEDLSAESYGALARFNAERYVQFRVTVAGNAPILRGLIVQIEFEIVRDTFEDLNTATESASWFSHEATGHIKIGMRKGAPSITRAAITAFQNQGGGYTADLLSKSTTIAGHSGPAAEFKIYDSTKTLSDAVLDAVLEGPAGIPAPPVIGTDPVTRLSPFGVPGVSADAVASEPSDPPPEPGGSQATQLSPTGMPGAYPS